MVRKPVGHALRNGLSMSSLGSRRSGPTRGSDRLWRTPPRGTIGDIKILSFACTHERRPDTRPANGCGTPRAPHDCTRQCPHHSPRPHRRCRAATSCRSPGQSIAVRTAALHDVGLRAPWLAFPVARPAMVTLPAAELHPVVRLEVVVVDAPVGVEAEQVVLGCANLN